MRIARLTISAALLTSTCAFAQWLHYPTSGIPRTPDGKPDLFAPAPRTPDGKPDLSGMWRSNGLRYLLNLAADGIDVPAQPWAEALYNQRKDYTGKDAP